MKKYIKNTLSNPLFSGSVIMILGSNSVNFINYFYHLFMGRLLGPSNYGELVSLISISGLLGIIPVAMSLSVIKYISATTSEEDKRNLVSWLRIKTFQVSIIFFIAIILTAPIISSFLHINKLIYLILIDISFLFSLATIINRAILQGLLKFKEMLVTTMIENFLKLIFGVSLVYLGFHILGAMTGLVLSTAIGWYLTCAYLNIKAKNNPTKPKILKSMIFFTFLVLLQSFATTSLYTSDLILVRHFFSSYDAGIYASLSTLGKIIFFSTGPVGAVMFPIVSHRFSRGEGYKNIFLYSFLSTMAISLFIIMIYYFIPKFAINLLYGSAYIQASGLLIWFGIFMTLFTLSSLLISFNLSQNKTKVAILPFIASVAQILLIWFIHDNIYTVILESNVVTALLLASLLIYSTYEKWVLPRNKFNISNSSSV